MPSDPTGSHRDELLHVAGSLLGGDEILADRDRIDLLRCLLGGSVCDQLGIYELPDSFRLSVVVPVYNEVSTVDEVIHRVRDTGIPTEIILVDDGSTDGTREKLDGLRDQDDIVLEFLPHNQGKGEALRRGFARASGDVIVVQDADLEYNPAEYWKMLQPIVAGQADVVFGSRTKGNSQRVLYFWHFVGNRMLTLLSNVKTNLNLSDMETCYKMFRRDLIASILPTLQEKRFGIEPELTAKLAKIPGVRVFELPVSYNGRTYAEGKKIGWRDGLRAIWCVIRY